MDQLHPTLVTLMGLAAILLSAQTTEARMAIACSPFVYPCQCGLCPHIVDCKTKQSAECFCGMTKPGIYAHPQDNTRFWMCSFDQRAQIHYGVEVQCPGRLLFDPVVKVCTLPTALMLAPNSTAARKPNSTMDRLNSTAAVHPMPLSRGPVNPEQLSSRTTTPGAPKVTVGTAPAIVDERAAAYRKPLSSMA